MRETDGLRSCWSLNELMLMTGSTARISRLDIWQVLGFALFLRILLPVLGYLHTRDVTIFYSPDTETYVAPARELIVHHRFFFHGAPEILRPPGYPILLTVGLLLGRLESVTILLQILLSCFTVYMVYLTAQLLFHRKSVAIIAAMLYAIEPLSILYVSQLLTETLFTAIVMIWLYFLLRYLNRSTLPDLMVSGIALSLSIYVRPIGYFLPVAIAVAMLLRAVVNDQQSMRCLVTHVAVFLIVSMGLAALWQVRNRVETGYCGFSGISSVDMYFYLGASVLAAEQHVSPREVQDRLGYQDDRIYFERHPEQKTWTVGQRLEYMRRDAEHILLNHPLTYARIHLEGIVRVVFGSGATVFLKLFGLKPNEGAVERKPVDQGVLKTAAAFIMANPLVFWSDVLLLPLELLYLAGACVALLSSRAMMRSPCIIAAVLTIVYYVVISGGPAGYSRFRNPIMPIICALSAYGLCLMQKNGGLIPTPPRRQKKSMFK